jgi:hypothetical protein
VVLVDHSTYDANLAFVANRGLDLYNGGPTVAAPGGTIAYYGEDPGYVPQTYAKVRLSDGAVLEKTLVRPTYGSRFWLSPDGLSLIITSDSLRVVDLR